MLRTLSRGLIIAVIFIGSLAAQNPATKAVVATSGKLRFRQIVIKTKGGPNGDNGLPEDEAKKKAEGIKAEFSKGRTWDDLAKQYSDDLGSKNRGGLYEDVSIDMLLPEVGAAVKRLDLGEIGGPVRSVFGFHIIQVEPRSVVASPTIDVARGGSVAGKASDQPTSREDIGRQVDTVPQGIAKELKSSLMAIYSAPSKPFLVPVNGNIAMALGNEVERGVIENMARDISARLKRMFEARGLKIDPWLISIKIESGLDVIMNLDRERTKIESYAFKITLSRHTNVADHPGTDVCHSKISTNFPTGRVLSHAEVSEIVVRKLFANLTIPDSFFVVSPDISDTSPRVDGFYCASLSDGSYATIRFLYGVHTGAMDVGLFHNANRSDPSYARWQDSTPNGDGSSSIHFYAPARLTSTFRLVNRDSLAVLLDVDGKELSIQFKFIEAALPIVEGSIYEKPFRMFPDDPPKYLADLVRKTGGPNRAVRAEAKAEQDRREAREAQIYIKKWDEDNRKKKELANEEDKLQNEVNCRALIASIHAADSPLRGSLPKFITFTSNEEIVSALAKKYLYIFILNNCSEDTDALWLEWNALYKRFSPTVKTFLVSGAIEGEIMELSRQVPLMTKTLRGKLSEFKDGWSQLYLKRYR